MPLLFDWRLAKALTLALIALTGVALLVAGASLWFRRTARSLDRSRWIELTNFPDSVSQPALSPDGHMLAFVRGYSTWVGPGQIYVKMLLEGEPVQLTHDAALKTDPTFSPDGSRIAYTPLNLKEFSWDTVVVQIPNVEGSTPMFGPGGDIFFRLVENTSTFVYRVRPDGTGLRKAFRDPIFVLLSVSPEGKWRRSCAGPVR